MSRRFRKELGAPVLASGAPTDPPPAHVPSARVRPGMDNRGGNSRIGVPGPVQRQPGDSLTCIGAPGRRAPGAATLPGPQCPRACTSEIGRSTEDTVRRARPSPTAPARSRSRRVDIRPRPAGRVQQPAAKGPMRAARPPGAPARGGDLGARRGQRHHQLRGGLTSVHGPIIMVTFYSLPTKPSIRLAPAYCPMAPTLTTNFRAWPRFVAKPHHRSQRADMLREVRMALPRRRRLPGWRILSARVKDKALGPEVLGSLSPGRRWWAS